jgi:hypothetical protein
MYNHFYFFVLITYKQTINIFGSLQTKSFHVSEEIFELTKSFSYTILRE